VRRRGSKVGAFAPRYTAGNYFAHLLCSSARIHGRHPCERMRARTPMKSCTCAHKDPNTESKWEAGGRRRREGGHPQVDRWEGGREGGRQAGREGDKERMTRTRRRRRRRSTPYDETMRHFFREGRMNGLEHGSCILASHAAEDCWPARVLVEERRDVEHKPVEHHQNLAIRAIL
jgi:hypothetical protein